MGIGTTAPSGFLEIKGPYTGNSQLIINTTGSAGELRFSDNGVPKGFVWYNQGADYMAFGRGSVANSMFVKPNGDFGIGTTTPDSKLTVKGNIHAQEVKVDLNGAVAPDYVFQKDYPLTPLSELKTYIDQNKHLPEIPSAKEMEEKGINLKEMNLKLLQKIEELTLHIINQEQRILQLEKDKKEQ
ncbi:MAG: tail fiber protein [Cytophagales bacterium]